MLDILKNLKLTNTHYIIIGGGLLVALFLVYYFFLRGPSVPQGAPQQMPPGAPLYKEMEHYEDMSDHVYDPDEEGYEDYGDMPELEQIDPQQLQMEQQQYQQQQQQQPVAHGSYQQEHAGEPMAANAGTGGFQSF